MLGWAQGTKLTFTRPGALGTGYQPNIHKASHSTRILAAKSFSPWLFTNSVHSMYASLCLIVYYIPVKLDTDPRRGKQLYFGSMNYRFAHMSARRGHFPRDLRLINVQVVGPERCLDREEHLDEKPDFWAVCFWCFSTRHYLASMWACNWNPDIKTLTCRNSAVAGLILFYLLRGNGSS